MCWIVQQKTLSVPLELHVFKQRLMVNSMQPHTHSKRMILFSFFFLLLHISKRTGLMLERAHFLFKYFNTHHNTPLSSCKYLPLSHIWRHHMSLFTTMSSHIFGDSIEINLKHHLKHDRSIIELTLFNLTWFMAMEHLFKAFNRWGVVATFFSLLTSVAIDHWPFIRLTFVRVFVCMSINTGRIINWPFGHNHNE